VPLDPTRFTCPRSWSCFCRAFRSNGNFDYGRSLTDGIDLVVKQEHPRLDVVVWDDGSPTDSSRENSEVRQPSTRSLTSTKGKGATASTAFEPAGQRGDPSSTPTTECRRVTSVGSPRVTRHMPQLSGYGTTRNTGEMLKGSPPVFTERRTVTGRSGRSQLPICACGIKLALGVGHSQSLPPMAPDFTRGSVRVRVALLKRGPR
jgi:hypothetical protein